MRKDLIPQLDMAVEQLKGWIGFRVEVVEQLCRTPGSTDRHGTARSSFVMRLENVLIGFSGAKLTVLGSMFEAEAAHEVFCELLSDLEIGPDEVVLIEQFGRSTERHSTIRRIPESAEG